MCAYKDVTLAPDDIEWSTDRPTNPVKEAVFDDACFRSILTDKGARETLELFHKFHRDIANQLIVRAVTDACESEWTRRAVHVCRAAKVRRDVARRVFQVEHGVAAELEFRQALRRKYPRAVWGSDMEEAR